jgi:hypothetical protein
MNLRPSREWISIGAVLIAAVSLVISVFAMRDARALSKLGIRPEIRILADFDEKNHGNNPILTVYNVSPIDIVQLELHTGMLHLSANSNEIEWGTTAPRVKVDRIAGNDAKVIPIAEFNASGNLRLFQPAKPGELHAVALLLIFHREPDLRTYIKRAFYVLDATGAIVHEAYVKDPAVRRLITKAHKTEGYPIPLWSEPVYDVPLLKNMEPQ